MHVAFREQEPAGQRIAERPGASPVALSPPTPAAFSPTTPSSSASRLETEALVAAATGLAPWQLAKMAMTSKSKLMNF